MLSSPDPHEPSCAALLHMLRDGVLLRWQQRICDEIPCSNVLPEALLLETMPELYDQLGLCVEDPDGFRCTSIARAHGAGRARLTAYRAGDLLREFQVLRRCVTEIAYEWGVPLSTADLAAIMTIFELAAGDALDEFDIVRTREHELSLTTLSAMLRSHLHVASAAAQRIIRITDPERIAVLANRIRNRLERIGEQLDGGALHDAALIETLPLLLSTFELGALAQEACAETGRARCTVHAEPVNVTWCRMSMKQALRNLLADGDGNGPVHVAIRHANGRAAVSVRHAHVLPPPVVKHLFSARGEEAHPTVREWGLGLAFVRDVAESHGGSAIVHSLPASGTEFVLDMPLDASPFLPRRR